MSKCKYYLLKTRGKPDGMNYLQVRSEDLSLLANVRCSPPFERLSKVFEVEISEKTLKEFIEGLEYGKLTKFEL